MMVMLQLVSCVFFFQAEDGIRDVAVTGVQTCALPISEPARRSARDADRADRRAGSADGGHHVVEIGLGLQSDGRPEEYVSIVRRAEAEIGRASCRERV